MEGKNHEVKIMYERAGFENTHKHSVRTRMEGRVCEWLMQRGVAHRHASEVFTVSSGVGKVPSVYVPDIILHDRHDDHKVIIETFQASAPKGAGTRLLAALQRQVEKKYFLIVVAHRGLKHNFLKGSYDAFVDIEKLEGLEKLIPMSDE